MSATVWLIVVLAGVAAWTVSDVRQYRTFCAESDTRVRRAFYWRWTMQSFALLSGASAVTLWLLGRPDAVRGMPTEFASLAAMLPPGARSAERSGSLWTGMAIGGVIGVLLMALVLRHRASMTAAPVTRALAPMIPRNRGEILAVLPLCLNAGVSEELFFRLALPLLVTTVTGSAAVGIGGSLLVFGLVHWYQGWQGVIATTVLGGVLVLVYLKSGSLLAVMAIHAGIDIVGLIIRPMLALRGAGVHLMD